MAANGRSVTLSDVAAESGVSLATASRVLNGSTRVVREDLRQKVLDAADRLGYLPNAQAQAVARGYSDVTGLIVRDIADPYFSTIAAGVANAARERGLLTTMCNTAGEPETELAFIEKLRNQRVRAIILCGSRSTDEDHERRLTERLDTFAAGGGRVVAVSQPTLPHDTVALDNRGGARALARALYELGYRRPVILAGPPTLLTSRERRDGFLAGWKSAGGSRPRVFDGEFSRDGGYRLMSDVAKDKVDTDCVFAVSDVMAVGAMAACRDHGIVVGDDLGVAGFDDIVTLRDVTPALTTVRLPLNEIGRVALETALTEPAEGPRRRLFTGEVILRESTPPRR